LGGLGGSYPCWREHSAQRTRRLLNGSSTQCRVSLIRACACCCVTLYRGSVVTADDEMAELSHFGFLLLFCPLLSPCFPHGLGTERALNLKPGSPRRERENLKSKGRLMPRVPSLSPLAPKLEGREKSTDHDRRRVDVDPRERTEHVSLWFCQCHVAGGRSRHVSLYL
jgi:hypothetical protein